VPKLAHRAVSSFQVFLSTANANIFSQLTPPLFMSSFTVCIQSIIVGTRFSFSIQWYPSHSSFCYRFFFHPQHIPRLILLSLIMFSVFSCFLLGALPKSSHLRFCPSMRRVESCGATDDALPPVSSQWMFVSSAMFLPHIVAPTVSLSPAVIYSY